MKAKGNFIWWAIGVFVIAPLLIMLYNRVGIERNNPDKNNIDEYLKHIVKTRIYNPNIPQGLSLDDFPIDYRPYQKGVSLIGYKAILGNIYTYLICDTISHNFFKIYVFDNKAKTISLHDVIQNKQVDLYVHSDDLSNPSYGSKEKPIPAFSFKGVDKPIAITSQSKEAVDGMESLEPTPREFEHNVWSYLTYIMSKEEFNARFRKEKN